MTVVTTMSAYAAVLWVVRSSEKLSINIWGRLEPPGTATCGDAILLAQIKLPHQRFGVFWQLTRHCRDAQVTSCFGRPTTFILSFSELLTGKPLCLPCLSTRFTSMDTPFQVTPHYCLLSPIHPIYCWCFNTFSWHDFVSNHLPIIATHGVLSTWRGEVVGSPKPRALLAGASWQPALLLRRRRIFPVVVIGVLVTWTRYENIWTVAVVQSPQVTVPGGSSRPHTLWDMGQVIVGFLN